MHDATAWTLHSRPVPSATRSVALCIDPRDRAAVMAVYSSEPRPWDERDAGQVELWRWAGDGWTRTHDGLFPTTQGTPHSTSVLAWPDRATGRVLLAIAAEGVLRVLDPDEPARERRCAHDALPGYSSHGWAFADETAGGAWLVLGVDNESVTFRLSGDAIDLVTRGPYLVTAARDEAAGALVGRDVDGHGHRLRDGRWTRDPSLDGKLDAIAWDPTRGAIVGLRVDSDTRMTAAVHTPSGWQTATPALWAETYRNQMSLVVDAARGQLLAFGGQDFDKGGDLSHETLYGREGALAPTRDPALPPTWGRYDTFFSTPVGLCVFDHSSQRIHRRTADGWETIGRLDVPGTPYWDDRGLNAAWGDEALYVLDHEGRLVRWTAAGGAAVVGDAATGPGTFYSHRVAMGWDGARGALAVFPGNRARQVFRFERGAWASVAASEPPVAGIAAGAGTPRGFYVLTRNALHLLADDEAWVRVGPALEPQGYVLRLEPRRGALLAANAAGLYAMAEDGWRLLAPLPPGCDLRTMGSGHAELGVDPARDELVLCDGASIWTLSLEALPLAGCALPVDPARKGAKKAATATSAKKGGGRTGR